jgi:hypothetical protein
VTDSFSVSHFARIIITVEWANGFEKWIIGKSLAVYFLTRLFCTLHFLSAIFSNYLSKKKVALFTLTRVVNRREIVSWHVDRKGYRA